MARLTIAVARLFRAACLFMICLVAVGGTSIAGSTVPLPAAKYPRTPEGERQCWKEGMDSISDAKKADRITMEIWLASMMGVGVVCQQVSAAEKSLELSAAMVSALSPGNSRDYLVKNAESLFWKSFEAAPWLYKPMTQPMTGQ